MVDERDDLLGDGLLDDLEDWDKAFDSLHAPVEPAEPGAQASVVPAPPRAEATTLPHPPAHARADEEDAADPFSLPDDDVQIDGEARALGALLGTGRKSPFSDEEDGLLTSAVRPPPGTPQAPGQRAPTSGRRSAAIVRRPGGPKRSWGTTADAADTLPPAPPASSESADFWPEERTEAMATEVVERLAESAEALFRDAPPEVNLELDEDFYEGIEVAASASESAAEVRTDAPDSAAPAARPRTRAPTGEGTRRTTSNIVRRAVTPLPIEPPSEAQARSRDTAATEPPPSESVELDFGESDGDESDDPTVVVERGARVLDESWLPPTLEQDRPALDQLVQSSAPSWQDRERAPRNTPWDSPWDAPESPEPATERRRPVTPWDAAAEARERPADVVRPTPRPTPWDAPGETIEGVPPWSPPHGEEGVVPPPPLPPLMPVSRLPSTIDEDGAVDAAFDDAVAIDDGTLVPASTVVQLAEIDVAPDLPLSPFAVSEPIIDFDAISVQDVQPSGDDRTEELARDLLLYERELALLDEPGPTARMRLEAGRLAEQLGDLDRARTHYDGALQLDPQLRPPLRALRRVERALGNFAEAVRHLDAEIELASARERRALAAHRADLLMAIGEQDVARVAVGDLVDEAPSDVRALLADLELAWVDGRSDEIDAILDQLAQAVADRPLAGAMARTRGLLAEARGEDGAPAYRAALLINPSDRQAWLGLAHGAAGRGAAGEAAELTGHLVGQGGLAQAAPALAGALEWRRGEPLIARGELAAAARSIARAAELLPGDAEIGELNALLLEASGQGRAAADSLAAAAAALEPGGQAARLLRRAAQLRAAGGDTSETLAMLRRAVELDPGEPLALIDLTAALEATGDHQGLVDQARRQVAADPDGALLARVRLARSLERLGRAEEATAVLAAGRSAGARSAALDADLERAHRRAGNLAEVAQLCRSQAEEAAPYVDPLVAERRAATALEKLARAARAGAERAGAVPKGAGDEAGWEERAAAEPIPEILFSPPSQRGDAAAPEASGLPAGVWREPTAGAVGEAQAPRADEAPRLRAEALAAWRRVLALDHDSGAARAAAVRLAEGTPAPERLEILAEAQRGEVPVAWAIELALRRAELLSARVAEPHVDQAGGEPRSDVSEAEPRSDAAVEQVLAAAAQLDAEDPRPTLALLRLLARHGRWAEAADLLIDRADALGAGEQGLELRYRAATILLDRTGDARRAVDLLTSVVHARPDFVIAAELLRAAQRRLGESAPPVEEAAAAPDRRGTDDGFARFLREAEMVEQTGDAGRAADLYQRALHIRPDDPLARDGFARTAERAGEAAALAELALSDLRHAEALGDRAVVATAYEELARIDAELRGDLASAILGWSAAMEADPSRMTAMRSLERAYLAGGHDRELDLHDLYGRMREVVSGTRDTVWLLGELGRLAERTGRPGEELLAHLRRVRELDPMHRMALFRLESNARSQGPSAELAELEQAVARAFSGDGRAEAAFYTRAGETLRAIDDREGAVASFRAAVAALPSHLPALHGWRDAAIAGGLWADVAEAAERAAASSAAPEERSALYHLAGVTLMDRVTSDDAGERAIGALRRVLDADPGHTDAFLRLKLLYEETGQDVELVELYHQRLAVESEPGMRVALHQGLSDLYRNFFDDRDGARRHLKSAIEIEPDNLRAVADLSDIAWELGDWAEAAEALIARAKLETRPEVLRHIFYRLGTIYADRLPDPRYAMMSFQKVLTYHPGDAGALERVADLAAKSGDNRLALGACEQLIKLSPSDTDKVGHLHRAARIYLDGLNDRTKAERAYRIALDMDPTSEVALAALIDFYGEVGDTISARVHLDRVAGAMRQRVAADPAELLPYKVLARALEARERAGVPGSLATARCAAEIAVLFGSDEAHDKELAAAAAKNRAPLDRLASSDIDDLLFPSPVSSSLRSLFRMLGERIAKQLGIDVRRHGVGRAEKLRTGGDPLAGMILEMAGEMGIPELDVYLSQRQPTALAVEPTSPPSLVLGAQLASMDRPGELRFLVGRALKLQLCSLAVPARLGADELGALVAGMLRQFVPDFAPTGLDPAQVAAEQQKLRRLIPSNMVQELAPFGLEIAGAEFDHRALWAGILEGGNRAGLLAAGSAQSAIGALCRLGGYHDIHQGIGDSTVTGFLRFAVSQDHAALRAELAG